MEHKKKKIIIVIVILLLIILITMVVFLNQRFFAKKRLQPVSIANVPDIPLEKGGGVDMNSEIVQTSISEIKKLTPHLPYEETITLSTGVEVWITIPKAEFLLNSWELIIMIDGIDYLVNPQSSDYVLMGDSFREAAAHVFVWMKSLNVSPEKIVVNWGGRAFIQEAAEQWLKEK